MKQQLKLLLEEAIHGDDTAGLLFLRDLLKEKDANDETIELMEFLSEQESLVDCSNFILVHAATFFVHIPINRPKEFLDLLRDAAMAKNLGAIEAMIIIAQSELAKAVLTDMPEIEKILTTLAEEEMKDAYRPLGFMCFHGIGIDKDYPKAMKWLEKVADTNAGIPGMIGHMYLNALVSERDESAALDWFRKGAEKGDVSAQFYLASMYRVGTGVVKNYEMAIKWFEKASDQGHAKSKYFLGIMYRDGIGVEEDPRKAANYLINAMAGGVELAEDALADMDPDYILPVTPNNIKDLNINNSAKELEKFKL